MRNTSRYMQFLLFRVVCLLADPGVSGLSLVHHEAQLYVTMPFTRSKVVCEGGVGCVVTVEGVCVVFLAARSPTLR